MFQHTQPINGANYQQVKKNTKKRNLAALPDEVKQMITDAFTVIAARTCRLNKSVKAI